MRHKVLLLLVLVSVLYGCAGINKQNMALMSAGMTAEDGVSAKQVRKTGLLGLSAAKGNGLGMGVATGLLLASGDFQENAAKYSHLEVWMPLSEAKDDEEAKFKMSDSLLNATIKALGEMGFKARVDEYSDKSTMGAIETVRILRIDGPGCEKESCLAQGSFPSATASTWVGDMVKYDHQTIAGKQCPCYAYFELDGYVVLSKVLREYDEKGSTGGHWRRFELGGFPGPNPGLNEEFYLRLPANLPDWAFYYHGQSKSNTNGNSSALYNQGKRIY
jgi:hypothetical protein